MIPYQSAKHQSGFSVSSKVLKFFERKQHFLRLGIRGLVVRLQQESTFENSTRLITDWTIKLVQCKVIPNQDKFGTWEDSVHWNLGILGCPNKAVSIGLGQTGKLSLGRGSLCSTARWHRQLLTAQRAEILPEQWHTEHLHQAFTHILTLARLKDWVVSSQVSPFLDRLLWMQMWVQMGVQGFLPASCARQTGNWGQILQHLSWNVKPQPKDYSCTIFWWALPPQWQIDFSWVFILCI